VVAKWSMNTNPEGKNEMTKTNQLPWDDDAGTNVRTTGDDLHARATDLATAAMNAQPGAVLADGGDYGRAQARYQADLARMRAARAAAARVAKAKRQAAHVARNERAKADAAARRNDKAA
jgi:hypothetical protein